MHANHISSHAVATVTINANIVHIWGLSVSSIKSYKMEMRFINKEGRIIRKIRIKWGGVGGMICIIAHSDSVDVISQMSCHPNTVCYVHEQNLIIEQLPVIYYVLVISYACSNKYSCLC